MSDFARVMEIALEGNPKAMETALGVPPPSLAEAMAENEKRAASEAQQQARPAPAAPKK